MKRLKKITGNFIHKIKGDESGAVLVLAAVSMVTLLSLSALVLDIGSAYLNAGELQKAADAAVFAAGRNLPVLIEDTDSINNIKDTAIEYVQKNGFNGISRNNVELGNIVDGKYTDIKVTIDKKVKTSFARVIGIGDINVKKRAKARLSPIVKITGAAPIGLFKEHLEEYLRSNQTEHIVLKYGKKNEDSKGFFGALDLDGHQGGGASDYRIWLAQGYPGEITVGDILLKENGNMVGPTYQGFSERYNSCTHYGAGSGGEGCTTERYNPNCPRIAKVVIYEENNKSTVKVYGFASFLLEAQTDDGYITGTFLNNISTGKVSGEGIEEELDLGVFNLMLSE